MVVGVLDICAGVASVIGSAPVAMIGMVVGTVVVPASSPTVSVPMGSFATFFLGLAVLLFISGVVAIVGGIHVLQRRSRFWTIAGAIAAVFGFFPLGVPAVILTVLCEKDIVDG
jgi:uncharacterized membrane protein HdeD (DUF308 family)